MPYTTSSHVNLTISANDTTIPVFVSKTIYPAAVINGSSTIINADVILDDKLEYKIGFAKDHPTKFIHYSENWERGLRLCMKNN